MSLVMAMGTESASAQSHARFHYHHLESFFPNPGDNTQAKAINNDHVIVGFTNESGAVILTHAFVWVRCPRPDLGLSTAGMHDLHALAGFTSSQLSIAEDVNLAGQVVGSGGDISLDEALIWNLATQTETMLGTLDGGTYSTAQAINDATPVEVVGWSEIRTPTVERGFRWTSGVMRQLLPFETDTKPRAMSRAHDINSASGGGGPSLVSGTSFDDILTACGAGDDVGTTWENNAVAALDFPAAWSNPESGVGRGVNDAGNIVGDGRNSFSPQDCRTFPFFWVDAMSAPTILPMPAGQEDDEASAHAITEPTGDGALQVVGINITDARAVLWERANGTSAFVSVDLSAEIDAPSVMLREAFDISDDGWIVSRTLDTAFLLIPIDTCWGDLNSDGSIGPADLAELLAQWGACATCPCSADLTLDNTIGPADLADLLASWGACSEIAGHWNAGAPQPGPNEPTWIEQVKLWLSSIGQPGLATQLHQAYYGQ